jgi:hypothetical protein
VSFGPEQPVSPQKLGASDKVRRWQELWFNRVTVVDPQHTNQDTTASAPLCGSRTNP